ncbi:MAG: hypothetical protein ACE5JX_21965 [Acidobacteriota bacterium]
MLRLPIVVCFLSLLGSGPAQEVSSRQGKVEKTPATGLEGLKERIDRLLNSASLTERSWALHLIRKHRLKEYLPALQRFLPLQPPEVAVGDLQESFDRGLLDALVELDAPLSPDNLSRIYRRHPDTGIVLLSRFPRDHVEMLLSFFGEEIAKVRWLALGNLLVEVKASRLVPVLMQSMQRMTVLVSLAEKGVPGGRPGSIIVGVSSFRVPPGFPPTAFYRLTDRVSKGAVVVAPGPHPIYLERKAFAPGKDFRVPSDGLVRSSRCGDCRDPYRFEYLAAMLKEPVGKIEFDTHPDRALRWKGRKAYLTDVGRICKKVLKRYDRLLLKLTRKGLLTTSEAEELDPNVELTVHDLRKDKKIPLPEIQLSRVFSTSASQ